MSSGTIHFIGVGESIHKTLPLALNKFECDQLILMAEENLYREPGPVKKTEIMKAIEAVKTQAKQLGIPTKVIRLETISIPCIRDAVLQVYSKEPVSEYMFNVTGGTKVMSNGLFLMSIWLEGLAYYVDQSEGVQILSVPRMQITEVRKNPNYAIILEILEKRHEGLRHKDLFLELEPLYQPVREREKKLRRNLQKGTLSKWVGDLIRWNLVHEEYAENSRQAKIFSITEDGTFALKFFKASVGSAKQR